MERVGETAWGFQTVHVGASHLSLVSIFFVLTFLMTQYTYIATLTLLVIFSVAYTFIKFKEGRFVSFRSMNTPLIILVPGFIITLDGNSESETHLSFSPKLILEHSLSKTYRVVCAKP